MTQHDSPDLACEPQEFLLKAEAAFRSHPVWVSAPPEHQQQAIEVTLVITLEAVKLSRGAAHHSASAAF